MSWRRQHQCHEASNYGSMQHCQVINKDRYPTRQEHRMDGEVASNDKELAHQPCINTNGENVMAYYRTKLFKQMKVTMHMRKKESWGM